MSKVVSLRLQESQMERLQRLARRLGRAPSEVGALLIDEALRRDEFSHIEFRNSAVGRQAYVTGSSLAVWEVAMVAQSYEMDPRATGRHLEWPVHLVQSAFNYAAAFPEEIQTAIDDNRQMDFTGLSRKLPEQSGWWLGADATG